MSSTMRAPLRFSLITVCALAWGAPSVVCECASAAPLDKNSCAKLAQDLQNLKSLDVDKLMANGPDWAIGHLSAGDLALVRQYIDLDEQVKFRCAAPGSLVRLKSLEEDDEDSGPKPPEDAASAGSEKGRGANAPSRQPEAKAPKKAKQPAQANSMGWR